MQDFHLYQIEDEAHDSDNQHHVPLDLHRLLVAIDCFDYHPAHQDPDSGDLEERANDLRPIPTKSEATLLR